MSIAQLDATLQGGLPMALAAGLVAPCPAALYAFFFARVAENTLNHSGLDSPLLEWLALKRLPLRASSSFHDSHHRRAAVAAARGGAQRAGVWPPSSAAAALPGPLALPAPSLPPPPPRRFSNHAFNARNYAESFWVFDWAFGTLSPLIGKPQGALVAAAKKA
jgi:sterol desaturase/sphingolipid hydroxylase (fatty acid hydroxylase superfamily)